MIRSFLFAPENCQRSRYPDPHNPPTTRDTRTFRLERVQHHASHWLQDQGLVRLARLELMYYEEGAADRYYI